MIKKPKNNKKIDTTVGMDIDRESVDFIREMGKLAIDIIPTLGVDVEGEPEMRLDFMGFHAVVGATEGYFGFVVSDDKVTEYECPNHSKQATIEKWCEDKVLELFSNGVEKIVSNQLDVKNE